MEVSKMDYPIFYRPICFYCKHFDVNGGKKICQAFPNGIPEKIWNLVFDHREAHKNDGGIQFEPIDDFAPLWKSGIYPSVPETLSEFEIGERKLLKRSMGFMELSRVYGIGEPRIEEVSEKYLPQNDAEVARAIQFRLQREMQLFEETTWGQNYEEFDPYLYRRAKFKKRWEIELDYMSPEREARYFEQNFAHEENDDETLDILMLHIEVYREINQESKLIKIFQKMGRIKHLRLAYEKMGIDIPSGD